MQHISSKNRHQIEFTSLDDLIEADNTVRFVDAFVDKLELNKLGFTINTLKKEGRPVLQEYYRSHSGKQPNKIIVKVARKLLSRIHAVIKTETPYQIGVVK